MNKLNKALIVVLAMVAIAGWLRPTGLATTTDYYFTDQDGKVITYDKPSWVDGEVVGQDYEGRGIYAIHYDSGWTVRVNRAGVVWRADFTEPSPAFTISIPTHRLILIAYILGGVIALVSIYVVIRRMVENRKAREALAKFMEERARRMSQDHLRTATASNSGNVVDVEQDESGTWKSKDDS